MIQFQRSYNRMFLKSIRKAIDDFKMINSGDKVAVGLSGGKDSIFLLFALKLINLTAIKDFQLYGLNIDLGFNMDLNPVKKFCEENHIPIIIEKTNIKEVVFDDRKEKNPCSLCAKLRRGALIRVCSANEINKIALGHNSDDVIETMFMNVLKVGKLGTFNPHIDYKAKSIGIIRPMVYLKENLIESLVEKFNLPIVKSLCPMDKNTTREEMKNLLVSLEKLYPDAQEKILKSLSNVDIKNLWI